MTTLEYNMTQVKEYQNISPIAVKRFMRGMEFISEDVNLTNKAAFSNLFDELAPVSIQFIYDSGIKYHGDIISKSIILYQALEACSKTVDVDWTDGMSEKEICEKVFDEGAEDENMNGCFFEFDGVIVDENCNIYKGSDAAKFKGAKPCFNAERDLNNF